MKINLGCGADYREGYVNVDFSDLDSSGNTIKIDKKCNFLKDDLPFEDDSAEEIIFNEVLEHFNRWNGVLILKKIYKTLSQSGKLYLTVPNSERQLKILLMHMNQNITFDDFLNGHEKWTFWKFHDDLAGGTRESDGFDGNSHKTFFSKNALISVLQHVGFKVQKVEIDSSIRVEATK